MRQDVPVVTPAYVQSPPALDGRFRDEPWTLCEALTDFEVVGRGGPASQQTVVRVCCDRDNLYIGFECLEDRMDSIAAARTEDGQPVWEDDSVQILICPCSVGSKSRCYRFALNSRGAMTYMKSDWIYSDDRWNVKALALDDKWIACATIPLNMFRPFGRNEECWRVNFCRTEVPHGERSSWSGVPEAFDNYWRMGKMFQPSLQRFVVFRTDLARLTAGEGCRAGLMSLSGDEVEAAARPSVIPSPQELHNRVSRQPFRISSAARIIVNDDPSEADLSAAARINDALTGVGMRPVEIVPASAAGSGPGACDQGIVVGETARNPLLRAVCESDKVRMPRSRYGTGAYVVDVMPNRVCAVGSGPRETYYAVQTLKQLMRREPDGSIYVQPALVRDFPRFDFRGVHLLATADAGEYIGKLIERVLGPLKINHIVLQTDNVAWESHPEIKDRDNSMSTEDVRKLVEKSRQHHISVIPLVQSPGHLEWAFRNGANLDIAEDPDSPFCYCMSNPKSREFIFSIMDEAIELFDHPQYLHAGRDEFDLMGRIPLDDACRRVGAEHLYYQDTIEIHEHLRSKDCRMMMWGDVLLRSGYREMIDMLPKDICITDWNYSPQESYPSAAFFQDSGLSVIGSTWYDPANILTFSRYASSRGLQGMLQTSWTGFRSEKEILDKEPQQVYAALSAAAWFWNPVGPEPEDLDPKPRELFDRLYHGRSMEQNKFYAVCLDKHCNVSRIDSGRTCGWLGQGRGCDFRSLPDGAVDLDGVTYWVMPGRLDAPSAVMLGGPGLANKFPGRVNGIDVGGSVKALHFLHGCAFGTDEGEEVGAYAIRYADGVSEEVPLVYDDNIHGWDDQCAGAFYNAAWCARLQDGRFASLSTLTWRNPRPDTEVSAVDFVGKQTQASPFLLAITAEK